MSVAFVPQKGQQRPPPTPAQIQKVSKLLDNM